VNDKSLNSWLGNVSTLFFPKNEQTVVKALTIQEIGDRPSEYLSAEFKRKRQEGLLTKKAEKAKLEFGGLKSVVEERGGSFSFRVLNTSNPPLDVTDFVELRDYSVVLFEIHQKQEPIDPNLLERSLDKLEKTFTVDDANSQIVVHGINNISCAVAVLVDKSAPINDKIESILFVWTGRENEGYALTFVRSLISDTRYRVSVATKDASFADTHEIKENIEILLINEENEDQMLTQVTSRAFDLIIMGGDRKNKNRFSNVFMHKVATPVLLLYPPANSNRGEVLQEMPA